MPSGSRNNGTPSRRVWLHVGMPKTGSTALQNSLYRNRAALLSHGILYPDLGAPQHVALARMLAGKAGSPIRFPNTGSCPPCDTIDQLIEGTASDVHTVIISSENFYQRPACNPGHATLPKAEAFDTLRRTVEATRDFLQGTDVKVVMWLRRQDNWLMSMYQETVKTSSYHDDIWTYAEHTIGTYIYEIVSIWIDVFGRENVRCLDYDTLRSNGRDIVEDFGTLLEIRPEILRSGSSLAEQPKNIGLTRPELELKRLLNGRLQNQPGGIRIAAEALRMFRLAGDASPNIQTPWPHALLSPQHRRQLVEQYAEQNERLCDEHGYHDMRQLFGTSDLDQLICADAWRNWEGLDTAMLADFLLILSNAHLERAPRLIADKRCLRRPPNHPRSCDPKRS